MHTERKLEMGSTMPKSPVSNAWGARGALRRIEDSGGKLNMVNCINDTHLNTVVEEAEVSAKRHTFRSFREGRGCPLWRRGWLG